jgi:hypothetical protein
MEKRNDGPSVGYESGSWLFARRDMLRKGTSFYREAAHVAHKEEHVASADKRLFPSFFGRRIERKKPGSSAYFAGTRSC